MRINELVRKSVVFLGILDRTGAFAPYGTGFIGLWKIENEELFAGYLITAKHVLDDMRSTKCPIVGRINDKFGRAQIGMIDSAHWVSHPNPKVDIAVAPFVAIEDAFDIKGVNLSESILTAEYIAENDIGCGDAVFTAGLLVNHFGRQKNIPIVRAGNIAAMPEEHVDLGSRFGHQPVYLIESRSIGGLSGSPVYLQTPPMRIVEGTVRQMSGHQTEYLMGVNIGLFETGAHADSIQKDTADRREDFLEAMSAGIAIVVPIQRALEIIQQCPTFLAQREEAMKQRKSGFTPSSAKPTVKPVSDDATIDPPASDANPKHQEDFTRLLNVAAQTREPKD